MKKTIAIAIFALALSVSSVLAADLPQRSPPPPPVFTWTGFYAGLNVGYGWGKKTSLQGDVAGSVTNTLLGAFFTGNALFAQPLATHAVDPKMIGLFVGLQAG